MEIVGLIGAVLLALSLALVLQRASRHGDKIPYYRDIRKKFKKKAAAPVEPSQRMFVAIRRHPVGRAAMMNLGDEDYEAKKKSVVDLMNELVREWSAVATFKWGFHGSEYGLPSSNDENWVLFASFVVENHDAYRGCLEVLQLDKYIPLRKQCDIRLLYGEKMEQLSQHTIDLFRQTFGK
ncbi:hypothetical protein JW998_10680 [candidate division KSB1 bacterium]|nr:hypothetical protein [candidate division KSB1 bacterium]